MVEGEQEWVQAAETPLDTCGCATQPPWFCPKQGDRVSATALVTFECKLAPILLQPEIPGCSCRDPKDRVFDVHAEEMLYSLALEHAGHKMALDNTGSLL